VVVGIVLGAIAARAFIPAITVGAVSELDASGTSRACTARYRGGADLAVVMIFALVIAVGPHAHEAPAPENVAVAGPQAYP